MAQYFTDFSEYTSGAQPSDWTLRWVTSGSSAIVRDSVSDTGGKVLRLTCSTDARRLVTWDEIDADANRATAEIYIKARNTYPGSNPGQVIAGARASGAAADESGYGAGQTVGNFTTRKYVSGVFTTIGTNVTLAWANGTIKHIRAQFDGTTIRARRWDDGDPEPGTWDKSETDSSISAAGWVGCLWSSAANNDPTDIIVFGVGTNGDAAPTEAPASGPTITNVPNMTRGIQATITGTGFGT